MAAAAGASQLLESFGLDLANPLARNAKVAPDLFEGLLASVFQPEPHHHDLSLSSGQVGEHILNPLAQNTVGRELRR